ncbi:hypothetical protein [Simkania sp.]|uniref:hypothetical protein n=1 Tax=Simkania sp. TaxID=34094 RepID=UPI003B52083D
MSFFRIAVGVAVFAGGFFVIRRFLWSSDGIDPRRTTDRTDHEEKKRAVSPANHESPSLHPDRFDRLEVRVELGEDQRKPSKDDSHDPSPPRKDDSVRTLPIVIDESDSEKKDAKDNAHKDRTPPSSPRREPKKRVIIEKDEDTSSSNLGDEEDLSGDEDLDFLGTPTTSPMKPVSRRSPSNIKNITDFVYDTPHTALGEKKDDSDGSSSD